MSSFLPIHLDSSFTRPEGISLPPHDEARTSSGAECRTIDQRIVRALSSFITRSSDYALARLEFAMQHPELPAPPVLERLPDASEATLRNRWDALERQLDDIMAFLRSLDDAEGRIVRGDATFAWLKRIIRELDQYGRALRWVLTVSERDPPTPME